MDREIKRKRFEIEEEKGTGEKRARSTGDADRDRGCDGDPRRRDEGGDGDSCDGEVEEFFAILRRIRVAVKYFQRSQSRSRSSSGEDRNETAATVAVAEPPKMTPWTPNFRREDFGDGNGNKSGTGTAGDNAWLDLNVKPDPVDE